MIEEGKAAPTFTLQSTQGDKVSLASFKGKSVVLYFYPKDDTPGCTLQAQGFNQALPRLKKLGAVVMGISADSTESHCKFTNKYSLNFPLLSDPDRKVIERYGAWGEKNNYGKKTMGIIRSTVIIGKDGKVQKVFPKVKVDGHVEKVLQALQSAG